MVGLWQVYGRFTKKSMMKTMKQWIFEYLVFETHPNGELLMVI